MNAHVTIPADRILLPRGLVGRPYSIPPAPCTPLNMQTGAWLAPEEMPPVVRIKRYKFRIGAIVDFDIFRAEVVARSASRNGKQIYTIRIIGYAYGRPVRVVGAEHLVRAPADQVSEVFAA